jgi:hypothetical protein
MLQMHRPRCSISFLCAHGPLFINPSVLAQGVMGTEQLTRRMSVFELPDIDTLD